MMIAPTSPANPHRADDADRAAAARTREASIAREALSAATRAEALARDAVDAADTLAADAATSHAAAAAAAEKAEASWTASQTAALWSGVERARSLRDQSSVRVKVSASTRESAVEALHSARGRAEAARAEVSRADALAQRADDIARGVRHDAKVRDDAAAAVEGARLRAVEQYQRAAEEHGATFTRDAAPLLVRAVGAARELHEAHEELSRVAAAAHTSARLVVAVARRDGALAATDAAPGLEVSPTAAALVARAVAAAIPSTGDPNGPTARIVARLAPLTSAEQRALHEALPDAPPAAVDGAPFDALRAELDALWRETRSGTLGMLAGDIGRAIARGQSIEGVALVASGGLAAEASALFGAMRYPASPGAADAAAELPRRCLDLAARFARADGWR